MVVESFWEMLGGVDGLCQLLTRSSSSILVMIWSSMRLRCLLEGTFMCVSISLQTSKNKRGSCSFLFIVCHLNCLCSILSALSLSHLLVPFDFAPYLC